MTGVIPEIARFGGTVVQRSLGGERAADLQAALDARGVAA